MKTWKNLINRFSFPITGLKNVLKEFKLLEVKMNLRLMLLKRFCFRAIGGAGWGELFLGQKKRTRNILTDRKNLHFLTYL